MAIETPPNAMFRRTTGVFIQQKLKKTRSMSARTESLVPPTQRSPFSAIFAWNLDCQSRWRGRRPMFHVLQPSSVSGSHFGCPSDPVDWLQKA
jgi:hypothetical protein